MYFIYCGACNCYEYDCHGRDGCVRNVEGYVGPHRRHQLRVIERMRLERIAEGGHDCSRKLCAMHPTVSALDER